MFAVKIAIGKTADLIKSSTRMDVASRWERKALSTESGIALLFLHSFPTRAQEKPGALVFQTERCPAIVLTL